MFRAALLLTLLLATPALARDPILSLPLDCTLGQDCFILNYVDSDPSEGAADFTCGPRSYDGHKGTDFAVTSFAAMEAGVTVLPAAPGVVTALRDGMPDTGLSDGFDATLDGRECGNGLVIDHGGGWETQYCHLKNGSLAVKKGQRVSLATPLGDVGYSGRTEFPHVHLAVRKNGQIVDPFNTDEILSCGEDDGPDDDLWRDLTPYDSGLIIGLGMADAVPDFELLKAGGYRDEAFAPNAPALVGWVLIAGGRTGDTVEIEILFPDRSRLIKDEQTLTRTQAMLFRASGKRIPNSGWPVGEYVIAARLLRDGLPISFDNTRITVAE